MTLAVGIVGVGLIGQDHARRLSDVVAGVFCEKPLAPAPDACLRIIAAEQAAGRRLVQVGFMRRYDPGYRALRRGSDSEEPLQRAS